MNKNVKRLGKKSGQMPWDGLIMGPKSFLVGKHLGWYVPPPEVSGADDRIRLRLSLMFSD
jgi:hypothetical protein